VVALTPVESDCGIREKLAGLASAQPLFITTLFTSDNGRSTAGSTSMFDITVLNPAGVQIVSFDVNAYGTVTTVMVDVYITPQTYVGKELTPSAWTKVASGQGALTQRNSPSAVDTTDFILAPGAYGMAINYVNSGNAYTNGTGNNQKYQNADLKLDLGVTTAGLFSSTLFNPRVWNGTIYYTPAVILTGSGSGAPGTDINFTLSAAGDAGLVYQMGSSFGNGPIPIDSRKLELSPDALLVLSVSGLLPMIFQSYAGMLDASGAATAKLRIPNLPVLKGVRIYTAFVTLKATAPSGIASVSNTFLFTIQ
jgi:hypothetical protein